LIQVEFYRIRDERSEGIRMILKKIHHIAVICSNYEVSKDFYVRILGLTPIREVYREERDSYKLDLEVNGQYQIELFSFPNPPARVNYPEAAGLRHLAFEVDNIEEAVSHLTVNGVTVEEIRIDEWTEKKFTFFADPDRLPIELYES
jgi:glyoxylase I family protein